MRLLQEAAIQVAYEESFDAGISLITASEEIAAEMGLVKTPSKLKKFDYESAEGTGSAEQSTIDTTVILEAIGIAPAQEPLPAMADAASIITEVNISTLDVDVSAASPTKEPDSISPKPSEEPKAALTATQSVPKASSSPVTTPTAAETLSKSLLAHSRSRKFRLSRDQSKSRVGPLDMTHTLITSAPKSERR
jgi:hypothetical protein